MDPDPTQTFVLLRRWHGGDREALDALLGRDLGWVRAHVQGRLGSLLRGKGEVDDYVQEAMVQVLQYGPRFLMSDKAQFRALLARITENVLRDHIARLNAQKRDVAMEKPVPSDSLLQLDPPVDSVTRPSVAVDRDQEKAWIRLAIELLDAEDRSVVRMREWQKMSFADIGKELGIGEDAARMRFNRILPKLARQVDKLRRGDLTDLLSSDAT